MPRSLHRSLVNKLVFQYIYPFLAVSTLLTGASYGQDATADIQPVERKVTDRLPFDPADRTGRLANGFTYFIRHNEEPKNRVLMYLVNKVGSILEEENQRGLAHFMEHMNFDGTTHFPKNELIDYLQKAGVRFGADINAYTSFDETVYQLPLPSDNPEVLRNGLQIIRDWAQGATLDPAQIARERGVVLEEKRLGKGADERMSRQYFPMLFNHSRYGDRIPIGIDAVLDNFQRPAIYSFYHDWYRPDLQALVVVGDIDVDKIENAIKAKFSDLENPPNERARTKYTVPLTGKNQFIALTDKEQPTTEAGVFIKQLETPINTEAAYRTSIIAFLYNDALRERIAELRANADPAFMNGRAGMDSFYGGLKMFTASVRAKPGELEKGFKTIWRVVEQAAQFGITDGELERSKKKFLRQLEDKLNEKDKTDSASYVREYQEYFLRETASPGIVYEYDMAKRNLATITLKEVNESLARAIKRIDRDVLIVGPEKDKGKLPGQIALESWIGAVEGEKLSAYQDTASTKPLLISQPVPGKITGEQKDDKTGILTYTLSNGIKVLIKKTNFKNSEVFFRGFSSGGTSLYPDADFYSANFAGELSDYFGAGNYSPAELRKWNAGKEIGVSTGFDERRQQIDGRATNEVLGDALELMYAQITEPRKDVALFNSEIEQRKASLANRDVSPDQAFTNERLRILAPPDDIRHGKLDTPETLAKIDLDRAYEIHKERFADCSGFTFVFTGSVDTTAIKPLIEKYIASLPALYKHERLKDLGYHTPHGRIDSTVRKGSAPAATVWMNYTGSYPGDFVSVLKLEALKEILSIRLIERLRLEESGVYGAGAQAGVHRYSGGWFDFEIAFECAPQNVDKLVASALDEVEKIKKDGPSEVNLQKYKVAAISELEKDQKENSYWDSYLFRQIEFNDDLGEYLKRKDAINSLTTAELQQVAAKFLTGENFIKLVQLPEVTN